MTFVFYFEDYSVLTPIIWIHQNIFLFDLGKFAFSLKDICYRPFRKTKNTISQKLNRVDKSLEFSKQSGLDFPIETAFLKIFQENFLKFVSIWGKHTMEIYRKVILFGSVSNTRTN